MICRLCHSPMSLDPLVADDARRGLDPDMPAPVVLRCRHGHSERVDPVRALAEPAPGLTTPRCAVCGVEIPRQTGAAPRKSCSPEHRRVLERYRAAAHAEHVRQHRAWRADVPFVPFRFVLEAQPWYRGAATAFRPAEPPGALRLRTEPVFPEIPAAWLAGFRALYPVLEGAAPLPPIFPPVDAIEEAGVAIATRRYRRRRPRPELTPEQLIPYPVREA